MTNNAINSNIPIEIAKGGTNASSMSDTNGVNYFDGTRIVTTGAGSAGQVLTSNGAGSSPSFQNPDTGAYTLVDTQVVSSAQSNVDFINLPSNSSYMLICENVVLSGDEKLLMRFSGDNGSTFKSTDYRSGLWYLEYNNTTVTNLNSTTEFICTPDTDSNSFTALINIYSLNIPSVASFSGNFVVEDTNILIGWSGGRVLAITADSLRLFASNAATIDTGTFRLYAANQT
jgi:hypothetical protein